MDEKDKQAAEVAAVIHDAMEGTISITTRWVPNDETKRENRLQNWTTFAAVFDWRHLLIPLSVQLGSYRYRVGPDLFVGGNFRVLRVFGIRVAWWTLTRELWEQKPKESKWMWKSAGRATSTGDAFASEPAVPDAQGSEK